MFEFPQLVPGERVRTRSFILTQSGRVCYVPVDARRHCAVWPTLCVSVPSRVYVLVLLARECTSTCIQLPLAIFSDWAWPGSLLPCFLLCIPNYGGEFLGRTTRIARFGLISGLNRDISRLQPSVASSSPPEGARALHSISDWPVNVQEDEIFFYIFSSHASCSEKRSKCILVIFFEHNIILKCSHLWIRSTGS